LSTGKWGQRKRRQSEKKGTIPFFSLVKDKDLTPFNNFFDFVKIRAIKQISLRIMNGIGSVYK
jgi:hypothetical protein